MRKGPAAALGVREPRVVIRARRDNGSAVAAERRRCHRRAMRWKVSHLLRAPNVPKPDGAVCVSHDREAFVGLSETAVRRPARSTASRSSGLGRARPVARSSSRSVLNGRTPPRSEHDGGARARPWQRPRVPGPNGPFPTGRDEPGAVSAPRNVCDGVTMAAQRRAERGRQRVEQIFGPSSPSRRAFRRASNSTPVT